MSRPTTRELNLESLKQEIDNLAGQLSRNSKVVADTGRRVLAMEIDNERKSLESIIPPKVSVATDSNASSTAVVPKSRKEKLLPALLEDDSDDDLNADPAAENEADVVRSDDIFQLVTELQGQLDLLYVLYFSFFFF